MKNVEKRKLVSSGSVKMSEKQAKLQQDVNDSVFVFGREKETFVPVYGPFAWAPDVERCTMQTSDGVLLERF